MRIAIVAPPFAGHLFPLLDLAQQLMADVPVDVQCYSTPEAAAAVELTSLPFHPLLIGKSHHVSAIANTRDRIGSNPLQLWRQLRMNLALMDQLQQELQQAWNDHRPDLVLADFTVPVAGLTAQALSIPWWTSMPTPCVLETGDGVPSYLGGWKPWNTPLGKLRDATGRTVIRVFKRTAHRLLSAPMKRCGVQQVYREDGTEVIYSPHKILALGIREFEFERKWPTQLEFIGPLTGCPPFPHRPPQFSPNRSHVLVTLGTHLNWAKQRAEELFREVARLMPAVGFHFTTGTSDRMESQELDNFHRTSFLPYDLYIQRYAAVVHHGGTGILYACLRHAIPSLVWPQDYDQFDHAARLVHHGLARRLQPRATDIVNDLQLILNNGLHLKSLQDFQARIAATRPGKRVAELIDREPFGAGSR